MKIGLYRNSRVNLPKIVRFSLSLAIILMLIASVPASRAQSATQLDKHARKVEKRLTKYRSGTFLQVDLRDNTETLGSLGDLSDATFQLTSSDNNRRVSISYADVTHVKRGKEYIGAGSGPERHIPHLVPILIAAAAAGGAVAAYEATR